MERRPDKLVCDRVEIKEGPSIKHIVSEILEKAAMPIICACLRDQIYLSAGAGAVLGAVQHGAHPVLGNGFLGNLQSSC